MKSGGVDESGVGMETTPVFFVSVASKGFSWAVSFLFATLAGRLISVANKGLREEQRLEGVDRKIGRASCRERV